MKYTIEYLLNYPTYMHRVVGYSLRKTRFTDSFGIAGAIVGLDNRLYARLSSLAEAHTGILGYANDFEILGHMNQQGGKIVNQNLLSQKDKDNGASFEECSNDFTKMMLMLNFKDRQEFCTKFIQYKISVFGKSTKIQSADTRKQLVANIKAENREYLDSLTKDIYYDAFSLMLDHYYDLQDQQVKNQEFLEFAERITDHDGNISLKLLDIYRRDHPTRFLLSPDTVEGRDDIIVSACVVPLGLRGTSSAKEPQKQQYLAKNIKTQLEKIKKDQEDYQKFSDLVDSNEDAIKMWKKLGGKKYFTDRLKLGKKSASYKEQYGVGSPYERRNNILYCLPQFSDLNEETASCSIVDVRDIDFVSMFQTIMDDFKEDCYQKSIAGKAKSAERA